MNNSWTTQADAEDTLYRPGLFGFREWLFGHWFSGIQRGQLTVVFPSREQRTFAGAEPGPHAMLEIYDMRLVSRMLRGGDLGFAESYMAGEWDTPDLAALLRLGCLNDDTVSGALSKSWMANLLGRLRHARRANTRRGSRRNIAAHYDLGNDFYRLWLDETMTYSSAVFADMSEPIVPAQQRKYRRLAKKLDLQPDDRVLEIGCGWGGFAEIAAAEFGCRVVGLTLSREQAAHARTRMTRLGVADAVDIRLQDYRDVTSTFDKIVSIEMFEAVGERHWPAFFKALNDRLVLGGRAALQIITIDDDKFAGYRRNPDFIQRYIFPGGMLPSPEAFDAAAKRGGFDVRDAYFFGTSYAESLRRWDHAFRENWPEIAKVGFDERFRRMWHYYLRYCEVGFDHGTIDVGQFLLERS